MLDEDRDEAGYVGRAAYRTTTSPNVEHTSANTVGRMETVPTPALSVKHALKATVLTPRLSIAKAAAPTTVNDGVVRPIN